MHVRQEAATTVIAMTFCAVALNGELGRAIVADDKNYGQTEYALLSSAASLLNGILTTAMVQICKAPENAVYSVYSGIGAIIVTASTYYFLNPTEPLGITPNEEAPNN